MQNEPVVSQLLMSAPLDGSPEFSLLENPKGRRPIDFEDRNLGRYIPRFGVRDLVAVAAFALEQGWQVDSFELADMSMTPLDDDLSANASAALVSALRESGLVLALRLLRDQFAGYAVTGVDLATPDGDLITLRRNGVVAAEDVPALLGLVANAWRAVHFS